MKSLRAIVCLVAVLLLVGLLAFQAVAERPQTKEIRDKVMWGDPDEFGACRAAGGWWYMAIECPDGGPVPMQVVSQSGAVQEIKGLAVNITLLGLEVRRFHDTAGRTRAMRR